MANAGARGAARSHLTSPAYLQLPALPYPTGESGCAGCCKAGMPEPCTPRSGAPGFDGSGPVDFHVEQPLNMQAVVDLRVRQRSASISANRRPLRTVVGILSGDWVLRRLTASAEVSPMRFIHWFEGRNSVSSRRLRSSRRFGVEAPPCAIPPSRQGRKAITSWQEEAAIRQLKTIALEQGWTQQRALAEALNLLFAKLDKPTIA
jgi:hypothetical protein